MERSSENRLCDARLQRRQRCEEDISLAEVVHFGAAPTATRDV
jgi:hypothetical protein